MEPINVPHKTWIVLADGEKALFLRNDGDAKFPDFNVVQKEEQENPPSREQGASRPGRFNDGPNVHRSAVDDTDWHRLGKERFAKEIADILYKKAHANDYEKLVIVAAPFILGELRKELHKEVSDRLIATYDKDLTNVPLDQVEKMVAGGDKPAR